MDHLLVRIGYNAVFHEISTELLRTKANFWIITPTETVSKVMTFFSGRWAVEPNP